MVSGKRVLRHVMANHVIKITYALGDVSANFIS